MNERFLDWISKELPNDLQAGLRVGQSYMNRVGRVSKPNPKLYYETDPKKAWVMIYELEEETK